MIESLSGRDALEKDFPMRLLPVVMVVSLFSATLAQCSVEFDPKENFSVRKAAEQAASLVAEGDPESIATAERMLRAVLDCQETRPGASHRGNFLWESQSPAIQDLNSVEFTLTHLIPMMLQHSSRLSPDLRDRMMESIRLGLEEIRSMDVAPTYTNIASMDCCNSCLGGELLGDEQIAERGYGRLEEFVSLVAENGGLFEFNSPNYTQVTLRAMALVRDHSKNPRARMLAELCAHRIALGIALRLHPETGTLAGPYSRAYYPVLMHRTEPYLAVLRGWIEQGLVPAWLERIAMEKSLPFTVEETAIREWKIGATTFLAPSFSLGVASREVSRQTSGLVVRFNPKGKDTSGVVAARYAIDDSLEEAHEPKSVGDLDRTFFDEGKFFAAQDRERAILVYAPRAPETPDSFAPATKHEFASAKASLVWLSRSEAGSIWVDGEQVNQLPREVKPGQTVVVESGEILTAALPLSRTELGHESPLRLVEKGGRLYFDMHNYEGPKKLFWDLDRASRFYQGQPYCAFYVEVANRNDYPDAAAFSKTVAAGEVKVEIGKAETSYRDNRDRPLRLEYGREDRGLGLEVDLLDWDLRDRWTESGSQDWPSLVSPLAVHSASGRLETASAVLACETSPAVLCGDPARGWWSALLFEACDSVRMTTPKGSLEVGSMGPGWIAWEGDRVHIKALDLGSNLQASEGLRVERLPILRRQ
jgi:hypothetical protein